MSDPVHPSVFGFVKEGRICIGVEWVGAMFSLAGIEELFMAARRRRRERLQLAGIVLALAELMETNRTYQRSCRVGLEPDSGNIFVRDFLLATNKELLQIKSRLRSVIEYAHDLRRRMLTWSDRLDLPDLSESPLDNGFART